MRFRCEKDALDKAFSTAGRAVSGRGGAHQVLSGVQLALDGDFLEVTGSDLDLTISVGIDVGGHGDGRVVLPAKLASDIVRALDSGQVEVEVEDDNARIASGRSEFSLRVYPPDDFPHFDPPAAEEVTVDASAVAGALAQVVRAASSDDSRPILTGVLLAAEDDGLRLVATDSYRLAVRDVPGAAVLSADQSVLVPSRALAEVARVIGDAESMTIRLGERDVSFEVGSTRVTSRLIEGDFPNYRGLIPSSHPNRLTVEREALLDAVRRVRLLAQEATPVRLAMSAEGLDLIAITQDVGQAEETVDCTYDGDDLTVAFNPEYLRDGLEVSSSDEVVLETVDALKPAVLRPVGDDRFLYLLMPVRVS